MTVIQFQKRRDTAANWTAANPVLAAGEMGYETDTKKEKTGDGVTLWNSLPYDTFELPVASEATLGGVKVGSRLTITNGVLSADPIPVMTGSLRGGARLGTGLQITDTDLLSAVPYSLPIASDSVLGGVKVGSNLSINESGVLSAVVPDPTGLTGTTNGSFQIDNDNNGPILNHETIDDMDFMTLDKRLRALDRMWIRQQSRDNRDCIDSVTTLATDYPVASDCFDTTVTGATVNSMAWADWSMGEKKLVVNITVPSNGGIVDIYTLGRNLIDLVRCVAWYRVNATPDGTTFSVITETSTYGMRSTFSTTVTTGNTDQMMDDESVLLEPGTYSTERITIRFSGLPAGTYNIELQSIQLQGYNLIEMSHEYGSAGYLKIGWPFSQNSPGILLNNNQKVLAGYTEILNDGSVDYFARYFQPYMWDTNRENEHGMTFIDMPIQNPRGSSSWVDDKYAFLDMSLLVNGNRGIAFGNNYAGNSGYRYKNSIGNPVFTDNLDGWTATAGTNTTINTTTRVTEETEIGSNSMSLNVTVAGGTGSLTIVFDGAKRLQYPTRVDTSWRCLAASGLNGITVDIVSLSEYQSERWYLGSYASTWIGTNWRSLEYQFKNPVYDDLEEFSDWAGEQIVITITGLPIGTYDFRFGGIFLYGDMYPRIQDGNNSTYPSSLNVTSDDDAPVAFLVEGNIVMTFRGASATAPDDPVTGHCYIDTSGTPVLKIYDGTSWV